MIKTTLKKTTKAKYPIFPLLANSKHYESVVLFINKNTGTVVFNSKSYKIGHYSDDWVDVTDTKTWEILPAGTSVTLTAE